MPPPFLPCFLLKNPYANILNPTYFAVDMKIPLTWLRQYIPIDQTAAQIGKTLTLAGLEVDAIERKAPPCSGIVVAKVIETQKHPEADTLTVAKVFDGDDTLQVVCGAPNCRPGIKVALARIGATLEEGDGKTFKIKRTKLRGVESFGMLCSAKELGISDDADKIIEFDTHLQEGTDVASLYEESVFEISLTPNLGHCSSLIGVARELSAATNTPYRLPELSVREESTPSASFIKVDIKDKEGCPRYACKVVRDVVVGPSPEWIKNALEAAGVRSINNVVDATNYVMLELGHPLHAFDADKLEGAKIIVRGAEEGERFTTLDGKERLLKKGDLLICDGSKPVALAGIMGGSNSEVGDSTKNIVLEAAVFGPASIRKTSKRLGLMTDASKRFERGCDPAILKFALDRVAMLLQQNAGGKVYGGIIDVSLQPFAKKSVSCRLSRINALLGTHLSVSQVEEIFKKLEFISAWDGEDRFTVEVPTYRNDIGEEVDLIEEVARIHGYSNITKQAATYQTSRLPHTPMFLFEREVRDRLMREGLQEFLTCDLIGPRLLDIVQDGDMPENAEVRVLNPTSIEQSVLRTSLLPGLLEVVKYNWDHQNQNISGFEIGRIHFKDGETYREHSAVAIVLAGKSRPHDWDQKPQPVDFYELKGIVENLLSEMKITNVSFRNSALGVLHPGRQAGIYVGKLKVGTLGEVHPAVVRRLDVPQNIYFAEINLHDLLSVAPTHDAQMKPLPIYPGSERDLTLTLPEQTPIEDVLRAVRTASSRLLESVTLQDIYRSEKLGHGLKNATFRFFYRDPDKTIAQEKVDGEHARIVDHVTKALQLK